MGDAGDLERSIDALRGIGGDPRFIRAIGQLARGRMEADQLLPGVNSMQTEHGSYFKILPPSQPPFDWEQSEPIDDDKQADTLIQAPEPDTEIQKQLTTYRHRNESGDHMAGLVSELPDLPDDQGHK